MTSFILRNASPAKTKVDAVVVGVVAQDSGVDLAPGGEEVAKAYGRKLRPLLSSLSLKGSLGETTRIPTAGTRNRKIQGCHWKKVRRSAWPSS
ncbi:MAG: hypothetical protein KJ938_03715 [Actinobacteria bacterium]|nr:hypothetical protein [Actinomycetota bacterium]